MVDERYRRGDRVEHQIVRTVALYLMLIVLGFYGQVIRNRFVISGNASATAINIASHESTWRPGIAAEFLALICVTALLPTAKKSSNLFMEETPHPTKPFQARSAQLIVLHLRVRICVPQTCASESLLRGPRLRLQEPQIGAHNMYMLRQSGRRTYCG